MKKIILGLSIFVSVFTLQSMEQRYLSYVEQQRHSLYDDLDIPENASTLTIQHRVREIKKTSESANDVQEACAILQDPIARKMYDKTFPFSCSCACNACSERFAAFKKKLQASQVDRKRKREARSEHYIISKNVARKRQKKVPTPTKESKMAYQIIEITNRCVEDYIDNQKSPNLTPFQFCKRITTEYNNVEKVMEGVDLPELYVVLEGKVLTNYYFAGLALYNNYIGSSCHIQALERVSKLCSFVLGIPFKYNPAVIMPCLVKLKEAADYHPARQDYEHDKELVQCLDEKISDIKYFKEDQLSENDTFWSAKIFYEAVMSDYNMINRFEGDHQTIALKHYYKISKKLFKTGEPNLALQALDKALSIQWQHDQNMVSRLNKIEKLRDKYSKGGNF